jgi:hypothetical protein
MGGMNIGVPIIGMQAAKEVVGVSDEFYNIEKSGPVRIALTGTASNSGATLPDATTVSPFFYREILNDGANFAIIQNSNKTAFEFLAPGEEMRCVCVDTSTAAGRWRVNKTGINPMYGLDEFDDFLEGPNAIANSKLGWQGTVINGGTTAMVSPGTGALLSIGQRAIATGTNAAGGYIMSLGGATLYGWRLGGMAHMVEFGNSFFQALSDSTETYVFDFGYGDSVSDAEHTDAICMRYRSAVSANWQTVVAAGGTVGAVTSAVAVSAARQHYRIVVNSTATRADFYVGTSLIGTVTSGVPVDAQVLAPFARIYKTNGTTSRSVYFDWVRIRAAGASRRS